ncbi:MAG: DUF4412 domain-containing protein [Thermoanaerobaculia bacterium]
MKKLSILLSLTALMAVPVSAGVVYEIEVTDHEQSPPKSESIEAAVDGRNLKMGIASGGRGAQGEMIFHGDRREMVVVDHEDRSYHVMDEEAIGKIAGQVSGAMAQMQEALKNVPEDRRAMVEQMMKQRMPQRQAERPKSELKKTGEKGTKNGYPCVKYEVYRDGRKIREMWVTDWGNVEGGEDVVDVFEDMAEFFREMLDSIPDFGQGGASGDPVFEHMKEIAGFPVVTEEFDENGDLTGTSGLRSARRRTLDPAAFEPPSGYKRRTMFPGN